VARLQRYSTYGDFKQKAMIHITRNRVECKESTEAPQSRSSQHFIDFINKDQKLNELMSFFSALDKDGNGGISIAEAQDGLYQAGYQLSKEETRTLWKVMDTNSDGEVDRDEFITALLDWNRLEASMREQGASYDDLILDVFRHFDQNHSGTLQVEDLAKVLDKNLKSPEVRALLNIADKDGNGSIDFQEFRQIMCGNLKDSLDIYDERVREDFVDDVVLHLKVDQEMPDVTNNTEL